MWQVEIRRYDGSIEKVLGPYSRERSAERVEDGLNINLNHDKFYTKIVAARPTPDKQETTE